MSPPSRAVGALRTSVLLCVALTASAAVAAASPRSYRNPVSRGFAETFAEASIIRGNDGFWYAYATSGRLRPDQARIHLIPTARSRDLVRWRVVDDVFDHANRPPWGAAGAPQAPDVHFVRGRYLLYYAVEGAPGGGGIGVATAPTPTGPWTDSGVPLIAPAGEASITDPALFTHRSGKRYLYFASERGAIFVTRLSGDGMHQRGSPRRLTLDDRYGGPAVVRRGRYLYLLASTGSGTGATDGGSIVAARARSPLGPFVDPRGRDLADPDAAGALVAAPNGNGWVGTRDPSIVTDLAGRSWVAYAATPRRRPLFEASEGTFRRPLLLDRLTWRAGWPVVRAGRFASQGPQAPPDTRWEVGELFHSLSLAGGDWEAGGGRWEFIEGGRSDFVRGTPRSCREAYLTTADTISGPIRAEADVRTKGDEAAVGLVAAYRARDRRVVAWLDAGFRELLISIEQGGALFLTREQLPDDLSVEEFHNLSLEVDGDGIRAEVREARSGDPLVAVQAPSLPVELGAGSVGIAVACGPGEATGAGASSLSPSTLRPPAHPPRHRVAPGLGDEFAAGSLGPGWRWVRSPAATVDEGELEWPTQDASLTGTTNTASVLLRRAPPGRYTVETKLRWSAEDGPLGTTASAGLVAYLGDDHHLQVAQPIGPLAPGEFVKEMPGRGGPRRGGIPLASSDQVAWLRMSHRVDPKNGEHEFAGATSQDGEHWARTGTWTLPRGRVPRVGLVSLDGAGARVRFAYLRVLLPDP